MQAPRNWGCDHDTRGHHQALSEASKGALRSCPTCGAQARRMPGGWWGWSEPRQSWQEAYWKARNPSVPDTSRVSGNWAEPRMIPWLPWDHPNAMVTSHKEAMRVCREWGIDPERGGFISEAHKARAFAAGRHNRAEAVAKMTAAERAERAAARAKNLRKSA